MSQEIEKKAAAIHTLSTYELEAYGKYVESGRPGLSPRQADSLYNMYKSGMTCESIIKLPGNEGLQLGMVLRARVDYRWDERRESEATAMMSRAKEGAELAQLEAIQFATQAIMATSQMMGDRVRKYLQTKNEEELGSFKNMTIKQFRELLDMFMMLTGQDNKKQVFGKIIHEHVNESGTVLDGETIKIEDAEIMLRALEEHKKKKTDE